MSKKASLSEKHWKALELIEGGKYSLKEIAQTVGLAENTLSKLYTGHDDMAGTGQLFHAEILKISKKHDKEIKDLLKENKAMALRVLNNFLRRHNALDYNTDEDVKLVSTVTNALSKLSPGVEISNTSFTYTKGLSTQELVHEFNKLRSLTEGASVRRTVPHAGSGEPRVLLGATESGSGASEESEDPDV